MPEVIINNLDLWTSALLTKSTAGRGSNGKLEAYGIKKLRELILELAARGKLVPQDPNDEPASVLLEKIAAEKARLVQQGVIRKENSLPAIAEEEKPYQIPKSWEWMRLTDVYYSISPSGKKLRTSEIIDEGKHPVVDQGQSHIAGYTNDSELLIAIPGPVVIFGDHTTEIKYIDFDFVAGADGTKILRPYHMDERFFYTHLKNYKLENRGYARHFKVLNENVLALPPLTEQNRIVAKVDELMALCDQLEQQQTHSIEAHQTLVETLLGTLTSVASQQELSEAWTRIANHFDTLFTTEHSIDQLKQTILQLAVMGKLVPQDPNDEPAEALLVRVKTAREQIIMARQVRQSDEAELSEPNNLFDVPAGWAWVHVKDVAIVQGGKRLPGGAALLETPTPHIYIRVTDMKNGTVSETGLMYLSPEVQRQISRYTINKEDLYITIAGTIGAVGTVPDVLDGQNLTENAAKIVFRILDKCFFQLALSSDFVQGQFLEKTKQMAQPKLALKRIAGAKFCLPPLNEQHRIVAKVDELMALCDTLKARLADAQTTQLHLADAIVEQAIY